MNCCTVWQLKQTIARMHNYPAQQMERSKEMRPREQNKQTLQQGFDSLLGPIHTKLKQRKDSGAF